MKEEEKQQKFMEFQQLQQQIEQLTQMLEIHNQQLVELSNSQDALKELEKVEKGEEVMAPIADGVFVKTKLVENEKLLVHVGSDTVVEKKIPEVVGMLEKQRDEIGKHLIKTDAMLQTLSKKAMEIYEIFEKEENVQQTKG